MTEPDLAGRFGSQRFLTSASSAWRRLACQCGFRGAGQDLTAWCSGGSRQLRALDWLRGGDRLRKSPRSYAMSTVSAVSWSRRTRRAPAAWPRGLHRSAPRVAVPPDTRYKIASKKCPGFGSPSFLSAVRCVATSLDVSLYRPRTAYAIALPPYESRKSGLTPSAACIFRAPSPVGPDQIDVRHAVQRIRLAGVQAHVPRTRRIASIPPVSSHR